LLQRSILETAGTVGATLAALEEAARAGKGAAQLDGKMIDAASERMARNIVRQADLIAGREY